MAAPSGTVWGSIQGNYGRIGIHVGTSQTNTTYTVTVEVWFWSKYSVSDTANTFYYNNLGSAGSATTSRGSVSLKTSVDTGEGWSTSNQQKLATYSGEYTRGTSDVTRYLYAKLINVDVVGSAMYANTTVKIPKLASYTVSYNANGGSGAPAAQTKWYGKSLTLSTTKPTRTGYSFQGWATSASGSVAYASGASYTGNAALTLYAVWKANTYAVKYNANGGTGAPGNQTKTYGVALTLSSTKPTRVNYNFLGWATSASAKTAEYSAGGKYTANRATTLYAVWSLAYTKPRISNVSVHRYDTAAAAVSEEGTSVRATFNWACDKTISSIKIGWRLAGTTDAYTTTTVSASGTSGSVSKVISSPAFDLEKSYEIQISVADANNTPSVVLSTISSMAFPIDVRAQGRGLAFGTVADTNNTVKNAFDLRQIGNKYCFQPSAFDGEKGYTLLATIVLTQLNVNAPITFVITKRGSICPMTVHARFASSSSTLDPDLASIVYEGDNFGVFMVKMAESTWNLYVDNTSGWSNPCLQDWYTSQSNASRFTISFPSEQVASLPGTYYRATPAKMQSLVDFIYPVGSVYISWSHVNPGTLFGGTWVRIENTFLWGCDENGGIGTTGGEKTHTLTTAEMPSHTHGAVYSGNATGTKNLPWLSTGVLGTGDKLAYSTIATGGGSAHNNMPPYVQVSIWRRTA